MTSNSCLTWTKLFDDAKKSPDGCSSNKWIGSASAVHYFPAFLSIMVDWRIFAQWPSEWAQHIHPPKQSYLLYAWYFRSNQIIASMLRRGKGTSCMYISMAYTVIGGVNCGLWARKMCCNRGRLWWDAWTESMARYFCPWAKSFFRQTRQICRSPLTITTLNRPTSVVHNFWQWPNLGIAPAQLLLRKA